MPKRVASGFSCSNAPSAGRIWPSRSKTSRMAVCAFALEDLVNVPVRLLSAGQAKRAQLARVMASGAPLWLLDEPQNGLDRKGLGELDAAVEAHRAQGGAVLAASHTSLAGHWRTLELGA